MDFDAPIYKVLAHNDTGQAAGHQGGFVLPKDLEDYLPLLRNATSPERPTVDVAITADLFAGSRFIESVETRYQYQTWGGERSPERRITGGISSLRNLAEKDDILIIERGVEQDDHYRFTLIKSGMPEYGKLMASFAGKRWGAVNSQMPPITEAEVNEAVEQLQENAEREFALFDQDAGYNESRSRRISRSRAFQRIVRQSYRDECSLCRLGLRHPDGRSELEAAHIVSRFLKGSDDIRNGLLLCRRHHWAFDRGLVGVSDNYKIVVPDKVMSIAQNESLAALAGQEIAFPAFQESYPSLEALAWHRTNILV
ncbi:MAG: HNH endonuclease [Sphingomonadaceae bacterium]|nr:HNH endonuclease [Sphingomonadaceae bacterium]